MNESGGGRALEKKWKEESNFFIYQIIIEIMNLFVVMHLTENTLA